MLYKVEILDSERGCGREGGQEVVIDKVGRVK